MRTIILNLKQQRRADILARHVAGSLSVRETAELLVVSERQVHRLALGYHQEGIASVVHGNRGQPPANRTDAQLVA
ncbi:MAG: helix-turn-helix domain-containing protein, partial [Chloroflexota bacterium]